MNFADKILPTQHEQLVHHGGTRDDAVAAITDLVLSFSVDPTKEFILYQSPGLPELPAMASSPLTLSLLSMLVRISGARQILEIGTFVGISAMAMLKAAVPGARVTTIEVYPEAAKYARRHFEVNGFADRVTLMEGNALDILMSRDFHQKNKWFDFAFIDGGKENYQAYIDLIGPCLYPGGLMVVDDVFFNGDVFNPTPTTKKGYGCRAALNCARPSNYEKLLLPIASGVLVLRKK